MIKKSLSKGFTLIELLIVIAIIAIIASVAFVALDPLTRFRDARDSARWADVAAIASAIRVSQVDNGGMFIEAVATTTAGQVYMIGTGTSGCDDQNTACLTDVSADTRCVDLSDLVSSGYLGEVPTSPNGEGTWTAVYTGYTLTRTASGTLTIRSCEAENTDEIYIAR